MTTAMTIKNRYFANNTFISVVKPITVNGNDLTKNFDSIFGNKRVKFKDGSMLSISEMYYNAFLKKMKTIGAKKY